MDVTDIYRSGTYFFPNFEQVGENSKLPHFRISSLFEDHEGYVWIGTKDGGLIRYDGYSFRSFEYNPSDLFSLPSNDVFFVFEDSRNMLWIGTDKGLSYYHPFRRQFMKLKLFTDADSLTVPRNITCITEEKNGDLLIGTSLGIFEISHIKKTNFYKNKAHIINHDSAQIEVTHIVLQHTHPSTPVKIIQDLKFDPNGLLWVLTYNELGMLAYDKLTPEAAPDKNPSKYFAEFQSVLPIAAGRKIYIDEEAVVWVNTIGSLLRVYAGQDTMEIEWIDYGSHSEKIDRFGQQSNNGGRYFWIGHYGEKLKVFDKEARKLYPITFNTNDKEKLHDFGVSHFLRTRSNVVFVGTAWGGLYKFNPNALLSNFHPRLQHIHQDQTDNLRYVYGDSKGYIWMIAKDIYRCDRYTGEVLATFKADFFNREWAYTNKLLEDSTGRFWLGTEGEGLYYLDITGDEQASNPSAWKAVQHQVIKDKIITALHLGGDGTIWAGTIYYDHDSARISTELYKINHAGKIMATYAVATCQDGNGNEADQFINQIYTDNASGVWMATGYGLVRLTEEPMELMTFAPADEDALTMGSNKILALCPDPLFPDSLLWLGSSSRGLYSFDLKSHSFNTRFQEQGIVSNHIASVLADNGGNLWLGTDRGLTRLVLDSIRRSIRGVFNYNNSDGLVTNDFTSYYGPNAVKLNNGSMIFTGPRGFQIIQPENIIDDTHIPFLHLTNFTINYKPASYGLPDSPLEKPISLTDQVRLSYDNSTIGFEMTALDFKSSTHLNYAFKLENYDNDWVYNSNNRSIQYTKLPAGSYTLNIKVATRDQVWGESIEALKIDIGRPWWSSLPAYAAYLFILIGVVWLVDRIQRNRQKMEMNIEKNKLEAEKLRELDVLKSKFFANISHEFKTPLTLILNPVEDMLGKTADASDQHSLLMIQRNALQLQRYITEILELSKLDANRLRLGIRELDLVRYAKYLVASFDSLARHKDVRLELKSSSDMLICFLDPAKLNTILTNLLSNAIKFTPKGGHVNLSVSECLCTLHENCNKVKGCILINVTDTGKGIPEDKIPYIFDRYYKGDPNSDENYGTGLGLALVRELVNLHKGNINVTSKAGEFTTFQIHFPMDHYHAQSKELVDVRRYDIEEDFDFASVKENEVSVADDENSHDLYEKIVLVVEDNRDMRTLIRAGLKKDYQVVEAVDGEEGIMMAIETSPDLIICDVMMPKKDGFEVARSLKSNELTSHIPIIFLTARAQMSDKIMGLETGADDYLIKPFYPRELAVRVKNLLEQRERIKEQFGRFNMLKIDNLPIKSIDQVFLEKVIKVIEIHLASDSFGVSVLMKELGISRTPLHRKLKALTNQSANELIQSIRLQKAAEMLKNNVASVAEIGYQVGFSSPPYFSRAFKQYFGHTPSEHFDKQA